MLAWTPVFKQDLLAEGIGCLVLLGASTKASSCGGFGTWYKNLPKMMGAILTLPSLVIRTLLEQVQQRANRPPHHLHV